MRRRSALLCTDADVHPFPSITLLDWMCIAGLLMHAAAPRNGPCRSRPGARRRNVLTPEAEAKLGQANLQYAVNKCAFAPDYSLCGEVEAVSQMQTMTRLRTQPFLSEQSSLMDLS